MMLSRKSCAADEHRGDLAWMMVLGAMTAIGRDLADREEADMEVAVAVVVVEGTAAVGKPDQRDQAICSRGSKRQRQTTANQGLPDGTTYSESARAAVSSRGDQTDIWTKP
jgi:hypothetical protein